MKHVAHAAALQGATANLNLNDEIRIPNGTGVRPPDGGQSSKRPSSTIQRNSKHQSPELRGRAVPAPEAKGVRARCWESMADKLRQALSNPRNKKCFAGRAAEDATINSNRFQRFPTHSKHFLKKIMNASTETMKGS